MGIMDKFLDAMRLSDDDYDDDDDFEFSNEEYYDDYEEPKKKGPRKEVVKEEPKKATPKVTPINKTPKKQNSAGNSMEVCVIKPNSIEEEIEIVDTLLAGRTVLINMEGLNIEVAQRIVDFTSGATYSMRGNLQKVSNYIFLATPPGVDISGDIQNIMDTFGAGSTIG